jgi:low temperature requirement protein LtrA
VSLEANFSRFGYSAHIRTRGVDSSANSARSGLGDEADRRLGETMKFWKRPVVRQYFHKGLIWRARETEEVAPFELFIDLLYVGIISTIGNKAVQDPTGEALLEFAVTFIMSWKLWSELVLVVQWFESDDIFQRKCILVFACFLVGYATNIEGAFDTTYTMLVAFFIANRLYQSVYFVFVSFLTPIVRGALIASTIAILVPAGLWIASIHVELPGRLALIWVAIPLELFGSGVIVSIVRKAGRLEGTFWNKVTRHLRYTRYSSLAGVSAADRIL